MWQYFYSTGHRWSELCEEKWTQSNIINFKNLTQNRKPSQTLLRCISSKWNITKLSGSFALPLFLYYLVWSLPSEKIFVLVSKKELDKTGSSIYGVTSTIYVHYMTWILEHKIKSGLPSPNFYVLIWLIKHCLGMDNLFCKSDCN